MALSDAAEALAVGGWRVFPVSATTKRPRTKHGHLDASSDVAQVARWAHLFDNLGAIATPTGNGLLVVDIDPRNGGTVPVWAPATRSVSTQSGGIHLHYAIDRDIKSRAGLFGPGVDSKSAGGYVVLPPSPGYEWIEKRSDAEHPSLGQVGPRAYLTADWLERHFVQSTQSGTSGGADRLPPQQWQRGIIHDQAVAWAAYFASVLDTDAEVEEATWGMVQQAKQAGIEIDNARGHIDGAIRWVLAREAAKIDGPNLG